MATTAAGTKKPKAMSKKMLDHFEKRLMDERKRAVKELGHYDETFGSTPQGADGDLITKIAAANSLIPQHIPHEVFGNGVRLTLVHNPGAAFGLHLGQYSRWIFMALTAGALYILGRLYQATRENETLRTVAIGLV